jgi:hypothetical protein
VEDDEGKLVVTIHGLLAEGLVRQIREDAQAGRGGQLATKLLPLDSLYKLMSSSPPESKEEGGETLTLEQILGQNIDQTFAGFEQQIADLKSSLAEFKEPPQPAKPTQGKG